MQWEDPRRSGNVAIDSNGARVRFGLNERFNQDLPPDFWSMTPEAALSIAKQQYLKKYFLPWRLDEVKDDAVCCYLFDCIVNPGSGFVKEIQRAVANVSGQNLAADGIIGDKTLQAINECAVVKLLPAICRARIEYYESHSRPQDVPGLKRRAEAWSDLLNPLLVTDIDLAT